MATEARQTVGTAAQPPSQSEAFTLILSLVEKVGYIIAFYFLFKSVPADKLKEVMDTAAADAKKTDTPIDDVVVGVGRMIADAIQKAQSVPTQPLKPGETVVKSVSTTMIAADDPPFGEQTPTSAG